MKSKINLHEVRKLQKIAGILKEGEKMESSGFLYFTDKDEWQEAIDATIEKIKSVYPNQAKAIEMEKKKWNHPDLGTEETTYYFGKGIGGKIIGSWKDGDNVGFKNRGKVYPGSVNKNIIGGEDLVYPSRSRKD